jgi:hypothetical protein
MITKILWHLRIVYWEVENSLQLVVIHWLNIKESAEVVAEINCPNTRANLRNILC